MTLCCLDAHGMTGEATGRHQLSHSRCLIRASGKLHNPTMTVSKFLMSQEQREVRTFSVGPEPLSHSLGTLALQNASTELMCPSLRLQNYNGASFLSDLLKVESSQP